MSPEQDSPLRPDALKDLSQLKRRAKELLRAYRAGDPDAIRTVEKHFDGADPERIRLAETQLVLARTLGFRSWARLGAAVDEASGETAKRRRRSRPERLRGKRYVYDVGALDSDQAWALFESCRDGDVKAVRLLLEADPNLVHAQHWYQQPIHLAIYADQPEILRLLLKAGAEPGRSRFMSNGWKPLLKRTEQTGSAECHEILVEAVRKRYGFQLEFAQLEEAMRSRTRSEVERVLADRPELARASDMEGNSSVHWAMLTRQPELVSMLSELGADLDRTRSDGQTPAQVLINGDYDYRTRRELDGLKYPDEATALRALLDAGASYDLSIACAVGDHTRVQAILAENPGAASRLDSGRRSPLAYASRFGRSEIVRTLLDHGADPNKPEELAESGGALFAACSAGHVDVAELLLEHGANPNASVDSSGDCAHIARTWAGDKADDIVRLLGRYGATEPEWAMTTDAITRALRNNLSISHDFDFALEALARNDLDLAKLLLARRPGIVDQLHGGCLRLGSPDVAITESSILRLLIDAGFDVNRSDWLGKTPLHHFAGRGETGNALLMVEHGADVDAIDDELHGTPLAWAAAEGHTETVRLLLEHGANQWLPPDKSYATPLGRARAGGHGKVVSILGKAG